MKLNPPVHPSIHPFKNSRFFFEISLSRKEKHSKISSRRIGGGGGVAESGVCSREKNSARATNSMTVPADELGDELSHHHPPSHHPPPGRRLTQAARIERGGTAHRRTAPRSWPIIFTRGIELSGAAINADLIAPLVSSFRGRAKEDGQRVASGASGAGPAGGERGARGR